MATLHQLQTVVNALLPILSECLLMQEHVVLFEEDSSLTGSMHEMKGTFAGSVKTSSAPKACRRTRLSRDMEAGMVRISLYPFAAATKASPMPVFPDVGSTRVVTPAIS